MEVNILLIQCPSHHTAFGVRIQKMEDGDWWRTWAFPIKPRQAQNEGYDETQVKGTLKATKEYPGCPHCGARGFVQCCSCMKISCWRGEETLVCPWCKTKMTSIASTTSKFDVTGGKF